MIASVGRRASLRACLAAIDCQQDVAPASVVVVDDGYEPPLSPAEVVLSHHKTRVVTGSGQGPSAARNAGVDALDTDLVFFTDDDTIPDPSWLAAGAGAFADDPDLLCAEGLVRTPPYDPLYEYSIAVSGPGHYWTCNVAYRRSAFLGVGGFDVRAFPRYREDRDLGYRVAAVGPTRYVSHMAVSHTPRTVTLRDLHRLVLGSRADAALERRHPEAFAFATRTPRALRPLTGVLRRLAALTRDEGASLLRSPHRMLRLCAVAVVEIAAAIRVGATVVRERTR